MLIYDISYYLTKFSDLNARNHEARIIIPDISDIHDIYYINI